MSLAEIEAALHYLTPNELRQLALKSWRTLMEKEGRSGATNECDEDDPALLAALDEALERAGTVPGKGYSGDEVRSRIAQWSSK